MINDGHFHFHYPAPDLVPGLSKDIDVSTDLRRVRRIRQLYNIDKIVGIFIPPNISIINKILEEDYIYPGIYLTPIDGIEEIKRKAKISFVKIGADDCSPYSKRISLLDKALANGFKKFQLHGSYFTQNFLDMVKHYIKECDALIYVAHGVNALYSCFSEVKPEEIKSLEGSLLLGTSPSTPVFEVPNLKIKRALDDGLENFITFESDFGLHYDDKFYSASVESVIGAIGENEKVLYENIKLFLK